MYLCNFRGAACNARMGRSTSWLSGRPLCSDDAGVRLPHPMYSYSVCEAARYFVRTRIAVFVAACALALPAWAHGEQMLIVYFGGLLFAPAAGFLLVPWCRWWARIAATAVLFASTIVVWIVGASINTRDVSIARELMILCVPTLLTTIFAIVLRKVDDSERPNSP
jgi:hypothetical protein